MKGCPMPTKHTTDDVPHADQNLSGEVDYEAAVPKIIGDLNKRWRVPEKPASTIPSSDGWFPPSRPRRGCEDC
jgi:hypothetical protein